MWQKTQNPHTVLHNSRVGGQGEWDHLRKSHHLREGLAVCFGSLELHGAKLPEEESHLFPGRNWMEIGCVRWIKLRAFFDLGKLDGNWMEIGFLSEIRMKLRAFFDRWIILSSGPQFYSLNKLALNLLVRKLKFWAAANFFLAWCRCFQGSHLEATTVPSVPVSRGRRGDQRLKLGGFSWQVHLVIPWLPSGKLT